MLKSFLEEVVSLRFQGGELGFSSIKPQVVKLPIRSIKFRKASELSASSVTNNRVSLGYSFDPTFDFNLITDG